MGHEPRVSETIGERGTSNTWEISHSIARSCGSVLASTLVKSLSSAASPLLELRDDFRHLTSQVETRREPDHDVQRTSAYPFRVDNYIDQNHIIAYATS
jgi:hypothetical protein